jgi:uncharacterized membrane protein YccC
MLQAAAPRACRLQPLWTPPYARAMPPWLRVHDPGLVSLRSAVRAAIVMPAVFAFADKVIGDPQVATFAAFGSFAVLVLVEFGGPLRSRLIAYSSLAVAGAANITIGTLCSRDEWLAAGAMAAIGFVILFAGIVNGYFAAASTSALLTYILAAMVPAPASELPHRVEGWALAAAAGIAAHLLLWPMRTQASLRSDAARAASALADLAETELQRDRDTIADRVRAAGVALRDLRARFLSTPHKPSGPTGPEAALSSLVDELDWVLAQLAPPTEVLPVLDVCPEENADAVAAVVEALRATGTTLAGEEERPDLDRLRDTRKALARALARNILEVAPESDEQAIRGALESSFRIRALSGATEQAARYAVAASGESVPELDEPRPLRTALQATQRATVEHTSPRDVWFRNSLRGAAGLAIAVYIAQRSGVQHGFWVVLGTLSVLRSNALGTGWSIVSALAGTAAGIVVGSLLVIGIGSHEGVLWAVLPLAVLLGSYAPRAISFAAGQAGFTVVLFVLFNIIQPVGWRVGLVRIEDVAIGFAISLGVGLLFWPRGAAALLRENLADAYARNADYVVAAERELVSGAAPAANEAAAAAAAAHRLDDAYRQALAERGARTAGSESIGPLVAGAARVRRAAQSLTSLAQMTEGRGTPVPCGAHLDTEVHAVRAWYVTLGDALVRGTTVPPPHTRDTEGRRRLVDCVREALESGERTRMRPAINLVWASQHLDALWQLEEHLGRHATRTALGG